MEINLLFQTLSTAFFAGLGSAIGSYFANSMILKRISQLYVNKNSKVEVKNDIVTDDLKQGTELRQ